MKQSVQGVQQDINDLMAPKTQVLTLAKHSPGLNDGPDSSQAGSLCSICSHSSIVWKIFENMVHQGPWFRALRTQEKLPWGIEPSIVLVGCKHLIVQDRRQLQWHVPWLDHRVRQHISCSFEHCLVQQRRLRRWKVKVSFLKIWFWEIKNCLDFISYKQVQNSHERRCKIK